jgi:hypothetical protein
MALITLPMGLDQQDGFGRVPMQSAIRRFLHGTLSLIPAYKEAYAKQEKTLAKSEDEDEEEEESTERTDLDLILPDERWRYIPIFP